MLTDFLGSEIPDDLISDAPVISGTDADGNPWSVSGQDVTDSGGITDEDYTGPDAAALGYLFAMSAGPSSSGAGCKNINCANLLGSLDDLFSGPAEGEIDGVTIVISSNNNGLKVNDIGTLLGQVDASRLGTTIDEDGNEHQFEKGIKVNRYETEE